MLLKKKGFPEASELVICTVTSVQHHSVFCRLDEYDATGMIHISEVSPGRIRNIRDFVKEGKVVVCKVLSVSREKGHIDLSLRRVTESQQRSKINEVKQQQKAEKIIEFVAQKLKMKPDDAFSTVSSSILKHYSSLFACFSDVVEGRASLEKLGIQKNIAEEIESVIRQRLKPAEVEIKGVISLVSYDSDGVDVVKDALKKAAGEGVELKYIGAGKYSISVRAPDFKKAEQKIASSTKAAISYIDSKQGFGEFVRK